VSAVANEELCPKLAFEIADLLRERRSGKVKPLCGPPEMQFFGNGDEVGQLSKFHAIDRRAGVIGAAYLSLVISRGPKMRTGVTSETETTNERRQEAAMSQTDVSTDASETNVRNVSMKLEIDVIPVSDVGRAKGFYQRLGWRLDDDAAPLDGLRIVQFTPPGSGTSITFGTGLTTAAPGSAEGGLVVSDIEAAHDALVGRGIDVSDVWHGPPFPPEARQPGVDPERTSYGSFCSFTDPDGNLWLVQEVTTRLPGRIDPTETAFASADDLENALYRAESAHAERQSSSEDENWPAWYASYMVAEQAGSALPA
jgi:catechol 2,3-dioxygenase-like lactoylglutathione lyase family enzyme